MKSITAAIIAILFLATGCASQHLRRNTVQHASTLPDIYEMQVLNNLARFVENPEATPHFELPSSGGTNIMGQIAAETNALNTFRENFGLSANRSGATSWTLAPITDPDRLKRMKCAFQRAVGHVPANCDECCKVQRQIITPTSEPKEIVPYPDGTYTPGKDECNDPCMRASCWFSTSCNRRDAVNSGGPFGHYRGIFVWIPKSGRADFSALVFDILNYASKSPASARTKEVTLYFDSDGKAVSKDDAHQVVKATIGLSDKNLSVAAGKIGTLEERVEGLEQTKRAVKQHFSKDKLDEEQVNKIANALMFDGNASLSTNSISFLDSAELTSILPNVEPASLSKLREKLLQQSLMNSQRIRAAADRAAIEVESKQAPVNSRPAGDFARQLDLLQEFTLP